MALPTRSQPDWDDELNNHINGLDANVQAAAAQAAVAASDAAYARNRADEVHTAVVGGTDIAVAGFIDDDTSATKASLSATYAGRKASPRGGQRPTLNRRPSLTIDQVYPNALGGDLQLVLAESATTLWAIDQTGVLRKSTDSGATWVRKSYPGNAGNWAKSGLFFKTSAGSLLTTYHPSDLTAPKIQRSTDDGATWADVVAAQTNVDYLGPTNIAQDPVTGYLYLSEYVTVNAATKATWKISRSTDDGATWATFHTFQRDDTANPTTAVRHGHGIQWDPIGQRIWFLCGDANNAAGLYRVNSGGTDVEAVVTNATLDETQGKWGGAVGLMFFPNYIAWGVDQVSDSGLLRMNRSQIGQANPTVEKVCDLQTTAFYCVRTKADNTEWLMTTSNENTVNGRLDNAMHIYRVADDAATCDEVLTLPIHADDATFTWLYPVGGTVLGDGPMWLATTMPAPHIPFTGVSRGYAMRVRPAWGGQSLVRPDLAVRKPHGQPVSVSSGPVTVGPTSGPSAFKLFGVTEVPIRSARLYIHEVNREQLAGDGFAYVEVVSITQGALNQTLGTGLTVDATQDAVLKTAHGLTAGTPVRFSNITGVVGVTTGVTYYVGPTVSANAFTVSATLGGPAIDITTGGTADVKYDPLPVMTLLKQEDTTTDMQWQHRSRKAALNDPSAAWVARSLVLSPGTRIGFRFRNILTGSCDMLGAVTYSWGF